MEKLYGYGLYIRHSFLLHKECLKSDLRTCSSDFCLLIMLASVWNTMWSKVWDCSRLLIWIVGSNPVGDVVFSCECCVLSGRGLCVRLITRILSSIVCPAHVPESGQSAAGKKCKIYNFQFLLFLLMFLVHLMLSCTCFFPCIYHFFLMVSWETVEVSLCMYIY